MSFGRRGEITLDQPRLRTLSARDPSPQKLSLGRGRYWGDSVSELFGFGLEALDL